METTKAFIRSPRPAKLEERARSFAVRPAFPEVDGIVRALAVDEARGICYIGGSFSRIGSFERKNLAAIDAFTGEVLAWNPKVHGNDIGVFTLSLGESTLYVGGVFERAGTHLRNGLAAIDAVSGQILPWNPKPSGGVHHALAFSQSTLYASGGLATLDGKRFYSYSAIDADSAATRAGAGIVDRGEIYALACGGSTLYAGGDFSVLSGQYRDGLAAVDTLTNTVLPLNPGVNGPVAAVALSGSTLYAGGRFSAAGGRHRQNLASVDTVTGEVLPWNPSVDANAWGAVFTLALGGSTIYAGGSFRTVGEKFRSNLVAVHGVTGEVSPWNPGTDNCVHALAVSGSTVFVGGSFTTIGGANRRGFAAVTDPDLILRNPCLIARGLQFPTPPNRNSR